MNLLKIRCKPSCKVPKAMGDLQMALKPVLGVIADVISKLAEWISNNPKLAATINCCCSSYWGYFWCNFSACSYSHDSHELV